VLDTATTIDTTLDAPVDGLLPDDNLPFMIDGNIRLYTTSYSDTKSDRYDIGDGKLSNKQLTSTIKCGMISAFRTYYEKSTVIEVQRNPTTPYVISLNNSMVNCQSRPVGV